MGYARGPAEFQRNRLLGTELETARLIAVQELTTEYPVDSSTGESTWHTVFARLLFVQELRQWLPIVAPPSGCKMLCLSFGESGVLEDNFGAGALWDEIEPSDRILTWIPATSTPDFDNSMVRYK